MRGEDAVATPPLLTFATGHPHMRGEDGILWTLGAEE